MPETPEKAATVTASPRSSPTKKEIDVATLALNNYAQGKRHLLVGDIPSAVNALQEACKLLAEQHGETAPECGDAYFCYGKALLEMARLESGVIGNALDGEEGSSENEEEDDSEADAESPEEESQDGDGEPQEGDEQEEENKEEVEGDKTEEDEEEVSNLQLAWEMLELAKVIFQKQEETNPKMTAKVAETYLKLGEVGLESENYPQGIEDFRQCLEIQKRVLKSDDRCIAETHYQLGIAHSFCDEFDHAITDFSAAVNVLETRIANLLVIKKEKEGWTEKQRMEEAAIKVDPFYTEQGEIDELNQLLPEMKEKIVDMQQMKKDSIERIKAAKDAMMTGIMGGETSQGTSSSKSPFDAPQSSASTNPFGAPESSSTKSPFGTPSVSSTNKAAKPIMVVRKKRKLEEEEGGDEAKKLKGEKGDSQKAVNGSKVANGGQAESKSTGEKKDSSSKSATVEELKEKAAEDVKKADPQATS